eukprot:jgi/Mesen1/7137/ME000037S06502
MQKLPSFWKVSSAAAAAAAGGGGQPPQQQQSLHQGPPPGGPHLSPHWLFQAQAQAQAAQVGGSAQAQPTQAPPVHALQQQQQQQEQEQQKWPQEQEQQPHQQAGDKGRGDFAAAETSGQVSESGGSQPKLEPPVPEWSLEADTGAGKLPACASTHSSGISLQQHILSLARAALTGCSSSSGDESGSVK